MTDSITLILPKEVPTRIVADLESELGAMGEVAEASEVRTRTIDVASIMLVLTLVSDALGVTSLAVDLFQKIAGRMKSKGISGAEIELPNGVRIKLDSASVNDIQQIIGEWKTEEQIP
jgi:hypothetical protein